MVGSHLNHGKVVLAGAQAQQRERHPDVVVQVADGGQHPELLGQHGREQLLGGGFAVRARDGQHRNSELLAVLPGQLLQRQQRVGGEGVAGRVGGSQGGIVDNGVAGPFLQGLCGEISPPKAGAIEREE